MAQVSIREYDAKRMRAAYSQSRYDGYLIEKGTLDQDIIPTLEQLGYSSFVIKPDQLFGQRGKHHLVGINLNPKEINTWLQQQRDTTILIDGKNDVLHTFLVEPHIDHTTEYYLHIRTEGIYDIISFTTQGGIGFEEHINSLQEISINVLHELSPEQITILTQTVVDSDRTLFQQFVSQIFSFFRMYGFSYLEINPCIVHEDAIICLDMVAKVDSCEAHRQSDHWKDIAWVSPFGTHHSHIEKTVETLDRKTGASLKLHVLHPHGRLWMILGGGGASVIVMDNLTELGLVDQIANYGELSGNPEKEANKEYATIIINEMLLSTSSDKCLLIVGGISNFTLIDTLFDGIVTAIDSHHLAMKEQGIQILVRRGGINDQKGLNLMQQCCQRYGIPLVIMDGKHYLTDIFAHLKPH